MMNIDFSKLIQIFGSYTFAIEIVGVITLTSILVKLVKWGLSKLYEHLKGTSSVWDDTMIAGIKKPLQYLIWLLGLSTIGKMLIFKYPHAVYLGMLKPAKDIAIVVIFVWMLFSVIRRIEKRIHEKVLPREEVDVTLVATFIKILRIVGVVIGGLVIMEMFGVSPSGLVAFGGAGGIMAGFAAKDLLSNFFGGIMIFLDRPFAIGDWIRSPDREIEGHVEHIGWRLTRILSLSRRPLYIPNSLFSTIIIENPSCMRGRQIKTTLGLRYNDASKMGSIVAEMRRYLQLHPEIDHEANTIVNFTTFGPSSMDILIDAFTKTTNREKFLEIQQGIFLHFLQIIENHGAESAFPTTTVHIQEGNSREKPVNAEGVEKK